VAKLRGLAPQVVPEKELRRCGAFATGVAKWQSWQTFSPKTRKALDRFLFARRDRVVGLELIREK
jgi:hypothetical protein